MLDGSVIGKVGTRASTLVVALSLLLVLGLAVPVQAQPFPEVIPLPNGWQPEGIAVGDGHAFYAGSLADGAIYSGDLRTGEGEVLLPGEEGRVAVGLAFDSSTKNLFVAGGGTGTARVVDTRTAEVLAEYQLTEAASFVNDAVVTGRAAYFTDSFRPVLYKVPLTPSGRLPDPSAVVEIALGGDFEFVAGAFNANGIDATPDGKTLLIINSTTGSLYRVDPCSGEATLIEVSGGELTMGDGILLDGKTLYVAPSYDADLENVIADWFEQYYTVRFRNYPVADDYLHDSERVACG